MNLSPGKTFRVCLLGASGSIGKSTLDIIRSNGDLLRLHSCSVNTSFDSLTKISRDSSCKRFCVSGALGQEAEISKLGLVAGSEVSYGVLGLVDLVTDPEIDIVVIAVTGFSGLAPLLAALESNKTVLIANKEPLVAAYPLIRKVLSRSGGRLIPLDSEHSSVFRILESNTSYQPEKVILTASGGPFRGYSFSELQNVTAAQAINHPTWKMGAKISVDSATLMNKGLELIEAAALFDLPAAKLGAVIHPQSLVHAIVNYAGGLSQSVMFRPDMKVPIGYGFEVATGAKVETTISAWDVESGGTLEFLPIDNKSFPAVSLSLKCLESAEGYPTALNAANEIAVAAFLAGKIRFLDICSIVESSLEQLANLRIGSIDDVYNIDMQARGIASELCNRLAK